MNVVLTIHLDTEERKDRWKGTSAVLDHCFYVAVLRESRGGKIDITSKATAGKRVGAQSAGRVERVGINLESLNTAEDKEAPADVQSVGARVTID